MTRVGDVLAVSLVGTVETWNCVEEEAAMGGFGTSYIVSHPFPTDLG